MSNHIANKIEAKDKSLSKILNDERFKIDVFQREYRWKRKHIEDLISDLSISFLNNYKKGDDLGKYDSYDSYYMGPIVLCETNGSLSIVDGQQRLTSITLLLIYLNHLQNDLKYKEDEKKDLEKYLYVTKGGKRTLVLDIDTREEIIKFLYENKNITDFEGSRDDESVSNIIDRFEDITLVFPEDIRKKEVLPIFIEWLIYKVVLVEVRAFSMENAYTIFETMNDRGMNLSPTEMLKGYLLSKIEDDDKSFELNELWKERIRELRSAVGADGDLDFFRAWLRAKYAETVRQQKQGATNEDFEIIGTQFHAWVRSNSPEKTGLSTPKDHYFFLQSDFDFFVQLYNNIYNYRKRDNEEHNNLYISDFYSIADSLSYPLYLAPITKIDDDEVIHKKIAAVGKFIDIYTNKRVLFGKAITQSSIRYSMYDLVKTVRNLQLSELIDVLGDEILRSTDEKIIGMPVLNPMDNWGYYHYFYARILYHLDSTEIDFKELLRSRKQSSYILVSLFDFEEIQEGASDISIELHIKSVAAHCLIKRYDYYQYFDDKLNPIDRLNTLISEGYFPEMKNEKKVKKGYLTEFITRRDEKIRELIEVIWK